MNFKKALGRVEQRRPHLVRQGGQGLYPSLLLPRSRPRQDTLARWWDTL